MIDVAISRAALKETQRFDAFGKATDHGDYVLIDAGWESKALDEIELLRAVYDAARAFDECSGPDYEPYVTMQRAIDAVKKTESPPVGSPENPYKLENCKHGISIFKGCKNCTKAVGAGNRVFKTS